MENWGDRWVRRMLKELRYYIFFPLLIISLSGCYDNYVSSIPNYPVNLTLNLTSTYPTFKNNPGQHLIFKTPPTATERVGFGGIIIYASFDESNPYLAFDLACPVEADQKIKVIPNDYYGQVVCEKCGTVYNLASGLGEAVDEPSKKEPLKRYKASLQGDWLYISYR